MQVIYEPPCSCVPFHPLEHADQLFVAEMVAEQRGKDNIGLFVPELDVPVVRVYPPGLPFLPLLLRDADAVCVVVDADGVDADIPLAAFPAKDLKVVSASAPDLANADLPRVAPAGPLALGKAEFHR